MIKLSFCNSVFRVATPTSDVMLWYYQTDDWAELVFVLCIGARKTFDRRIPENVSNSKNSYTHLIKHCIFNMWNSISPSYATIYTTVIVRKTRVAANAAEVKTQAYFSRNVCSVGLVFGSCWDVSWCLIGLVVSNAALPSCCLQLGSDRQKWKRGDSFNMWRDFAISFSNT